MRAVILAAGYDPRLRPHSDRTPKALIAVGGIPILRRAMTALVRSGVEQFVIVVGYLQQQIRTAVAGWFPGLDVTFIVNPAYASTGTATSLALARPFVAGDAFVVVDGDVVFHPDVVTRLFERGLDAVAVRSVGALGGEEVKVAADAGDRVRAIGKDVPVRGAMGESIGVQSFTAATGRRLFAALDDGASTDRYYEDAMQRLVDDGAALSAVDIGSLYAIEIDTVDDLRAAEGLTTAAPAFDARVGLRLAV